MIECVNDLEIKVMKSARGFYLGTESLDEEYGCENLDYMMPWCRVSSEYWTTKEEAQDALDNWNFVERHCIENEFCSQSCGSKTCFRR